MTDLRTGAAGGIALKHLGLAPDALGSTNTIGFVGCGAIARVMARAAKAVRPDFKGLCWAPDGSHETFAGRAEPGFDGRARLSTPGFDGRARLSTL